MKRALFLDRDGTLIVDTGYPGNPDAVQLVPNAAWALRYLQQYVSLVIVTNQSGLSRGLINPAQMMAVAARVDALYLAEGVKFAGAYVCPHGPDDGCKCRKPQPGMLLDAAKDLKLDLRRSIMIGDKDSDVQAGHNAGCGASLRFTAWSHDGPIIASLFGVE